MDRLLAYVYAIGRSLIPYVLTLTLDCNSTGVYGGVVAGGNGNTADLSNINSTYLRGLQQTKEEGVAQITSLFPGHYSGRCPHIHIATHVNGT